MARMQLQLEKQLRRRSPIADIVRTTAYSYGLSIESNVTKLLVMVTHQR